LLAVLRTTPAAAGAVSRAEERGFPRETSGAASVTPAIRARVRRERDTCHRLSSSLSDDGLFQKPEGLSPKAESLM
jgi:hypothetical protein